MTKLCVCYFSAATLFWRLVTEKEVALSKTSKCICDLQDHWQSPRPPCWPLHRTALRSMLIKVKMNCRSSDLYALIHYEYNCCPQKIQRRIQETRLSNTINTKSHLQLRSDRVSDLGSLCNEAPGGFLMRKLKTQSSSCGPKQLGCLSCQKIAQTDFYLFKNAILH